MTSITEYLEHERRRINEALQRFFDSERDAADNVHPLAREVFDIVADFTLGPGKRLRPILMIVGYRAAGGQDEEAILIASCCLELTQTMLLVHDDIMDKSDRRRGRPAVHVDLARRYGGQSAGQRLRSGDSAHFGTALAIAAGDLAGQLALRALTRAGFSPANLVRALDVYTAMTRDVCYGQVLDMHAGDRDMGLAESDVLTIHHYKTARYTTEGPLHLGAVLAGADATLLASLSSYALPLGQAFQLQDDLLGVFGCEEETGKPADADLKQGKRTLLVLKALEWGSPTQIAALEGVLGNAQAGPDLVMCARQVLEETGARHYCQQRALELADQARAALLPVPLQPEAKQVLLGLVDCMVDRVK